MEVEQLKVIAKGMGKVVSIKQPKDKTDRPPYVKLHGVFNQDYDPENNPAQLLEIIEKLLKGDIEIAGVDDEIRIYPKEYPEKQYVMGETLFEAVLQAAYEAMK